MLGEGTIAMSILSLSPARLDNLSISLALW